MGLAELAAAAAPDDLELSEDELAASVCRDSYLEFLKEFWSEVSQEEPHWNWHIEYLCGEIQEALERVFRGEPRLYDLVINQPPGTTKSTVVTVMVLPWAWTRMPSFKMIGASYSGLLAADDHSLKARDVVKSEKYKRYFPEVEVRDDMDTRGNFHNTAGGWRYATGMTGAATGKHAHYIAVDDPLDPNQAASEAELARVNRWVTTVLSNRKVDKEVTLTALVMQRLHEGDPTGVMLRKKRVKHIKLPAEVQDNPRPPELSQYYVDGLLDPKRLSRASIEDAKEEGEVYYCTPGFTPILMSDFREKKIEDVEIGEEVVGFSIGKARKTKSFTKLTPATVISKNSWDREVVRVTMESGRVVYCTPDHEWWTRRQPTPGDPYKAAYLPPEVGRKLWSVYTPAPEPGPREQRMLDWLSGFVDGEGACKYGNINITQSWAKNPRLCRRLERVLSELGIEYTLNKRESLSPRGGKPYGEMRCYVLRGGRSMKIRLLQRGWLCKANQVRKTLWDTAGYVAENGDRVVKVEPAGTMTVYGMETTTGNYVAGGYASRNSAQFRQNPAPPGGAKFDVTKVVSLQPPPARDLVRVVRYWDKAASVAVDADWTVGTKLGVDRDGRYWVLDVVRFKKNSWDREKKIRETAEADGRNVVVGVEQEPGSGGKDSADNTATRTLSGFRVKIYKVGASEGNKAARADPLSVQVNRGNLYLAAAPWNRDWREEFRVFPFGRHDDQVDSGAGAFQMLFKKRRRVGGLTK